MGIVMYDSVDVFTVPDNPPAVAGYVGGSWPTYNGLVRRFPNAHHLSIAVQAFEDAECLDCENGDATPSQVPAWIDRQLARGVHRPCVYASLSVWQTDLNRRLAGYGNRIRKWCADWTFNNPSEPLAGYDAQQWTDRALGRNLDQSICRDDFFDTAVPQPPPPPPGVIVMGITVVQRSDDHRFEAFVIDKNGQVWHTWQTPDQQGHVDWRKDASGKVLWSSLGTPQ